MSQTSSKNAYNQAQIRVERNLNSSLFRKKCVSFSPKTIPAIVFARLSASKANYKNEMMTRLISYTRLFPSPRHFLSHEIINYKNITPFLKILNYYFTKIFSFVFKKVICMVIPILGVIRFLFL